MLIWGKELGAGLVLPSGQIALNTVLPAKEDLQLSRGFSGCPTQCILPRR